MLGNTDYEYRQCLDSRLRVMRVSLGGLWCEMASLILEMVLLLVLLSFHFFWEGVFFKKDVGLEFIYSFNITIDFFSFLHASFFFLSRAA